MTDRHWTSHAPKLEYALTEEQEFLGAKIPAPPLLLSRLACKWLFAPHFETNYATRLESNVVKPLQQDHNSPGLSSRSTEQYKAWYAPHISDDLRLKFVAPLSTDQRDRITAPLENLMHDPDLQKLEAPVHSFNPLLESLKSSPFHAGFNAIKNKTQLQLAVFPIFKSIVDIVSTLFTRSYIRAPVGKLGVCYTFAACRNTSTRHDEDDNVSLLRSSMKTQTGFDGDYYVYIPHDQFSSGVNNHKCTKYVLQDSLLHPGNIVTLAAEFEAELHFEVPTSKMAYPDVLCQVSHASQGHDSKYHVYDFKVLHESSSKLADFRVDRLGVLDEILGTDQAQGAQDVELPTADLSDPIELLWAQMVSQGAYIGLLMNWHSRNHLCVRDPRTGTLYISDSLINRLMGMPFEDCCESFADAMDKEDFPWSDQFDTSSLMFVIGGAILTGFRLLHPNLPEKPFVRKSQSNREPWKAAKDDLKEHRRKRHEEVKAMSFAELSIHLSHHPSNSHGVSPLQCHDLTSQGRACTDSNTAGNSQGPEYGPTLHSIQKKGINDGRTPEKLYLGIFDGDLYHSKKLEVFYSWDSGIGIPNTHHSESWVPTVFLHRLVAEGAVGDVWQGYAALPNQASPVPIAAKLAFAPEDIDSLDHEHSVYQFLGNDPNLPIPQMYGYYKSIPDEIGQQVGLLLLSWEGVTPQYEYEVQEYKSLIIEAFEKLHRRGVVHGDVAHRNILINEGKVTLIDFDRAGVNTMSPKVDMDELKDMIGSM